MAGRANSGLDEPEVLEQVPHWMFTFTGSATSLLTRTLALISAYPAVHRRVMAELAAAGPVGDESFASADLTFLEACLWEAACLYPPVTRTFHRAANGASIGTVQIPAGTEIMHLFPLFTSDGTDRPRRFEPDRWLKDDPPVYSFDPFLGGARRCPGERLILLICKTALASLLTRHRTVVLAPGIGVGPLPAAFPRHGVQILRCC
jgi:cytochrome P450